MPPLFASDLDGTLIPIVPEGGPRSGLDAHGARAWGAEPDAQTAATVRFRRFAEASGWFVMYVTGRHLELALDGIDRHGLPRPAALACDVGTSLFWRERGVWVRDEAYRARVAASPGVAPERQIRSRLRGLDGLVLQAAEKQAEFKVSYHVDGPVSAELLAEVGERLGPPISARLVASHDPLTGRGLLDVLPASIGKRTAVDHVAARLDVGGDEVVYAGDSGNDRDALLAGTRAIVVGNAPAALVEELRTEAERLGIAASIYYASAPWTQGVVEGLHHFGAWSVDDEGEP